MRRFGLILSICVVFTSTLAYGQAPSALPFFRIAKSQRPTPPDQSSESDWLASTTRGVRMPGSGEGISPTPVGTPGDRMPITEGKKDYVFPSFGPTGPFNDLRMGLGILNMLRTSRSGPVVIENMALALVEPAMQKGDADSAQEVSDHYGNLMQSYSNYIAAASANPEVGEWMLQATNNCLKTQMQSRPAAEALSYCLYDRETAMPQGVASLAGPGSLIDHHPDLPPVAAGAPGSPGGPAGPPGPGGGATAGLLCLDDLAMNLSVPAGDPTAPVQATPTAGGRCLTDLQTPPTPVPGPMSGIVIDDLRAYINSRIGCFCNRSDAAAGGAPPGGTAVNDQQASRTLSFEYRPPPLADATTGATRLEQDFYDNLKVVYDTELKLFQNYCLLEGTLIAVGGSGNEPLKFNEWVERRFWEKTGGGTDAPPTGSIATLSMDGFKFDPQIGDALFFFFLRSKLSTSSQGIQPADCNLLDPAASGSKANLDTVRSNPAGTPDYLRYMFRYAFIIARGQYLESLAAMQQFMTNLTANAWVRGKIYEHYVDKIAKAARIDPTDGRPLSSIIDDNVAEMYRLRAELFKYMQNQIGGGGKSVTGQIKGERGTSNDMNQ